MSQAKTNILSRLRKDNTKNTFKTERFKQALTPPLTNKPDLLVSKLKENHAEVHRINKAKWKEKFIEILEQERVTHCLLGQNLDYQNELATTLLKTLSKLKITRFNQQYDTIKESLFHSIDISLTLAQAAIAETGTLVLIPDENEPRTMSLIPPIHVVLLYEEQIVDTMSSFINAEPWRDLNRMPTNILFVSSPSKTADIQQTLAYGAHGPKKLIVLVVDNKD